MTRTVLAVGRPAANVSPRSGIFSKVGSIAGEAVHDLGSAATEAEGLVFKKYDDAVEDRFGAGTTTTDTGMAIPRALWRIAAFVGGAAALGLLA